MYQVDDFLARQPLELVVVFDEGGAEVQDLDRELRKAFNRSLEDIMFGTYKRHGDVASFIVW